MLLELDWIAWETKRKGAFAASLQLSAAVDADGCADAKLCCKGLIDVIVVQRDSGEKVDELLVLVMGRQNKLVY